MLKRAEFAARRIAKLVVTGHFAFIFLLLAAHATVRWLAPFLDWDWLGNAGGMLDLNNEHNLPTLFSAAMLFVTGTVAGAISILSRGTANRLVIGWAFAALCLLFMAMDEAMMLHERLIFLLEERAQTGGPFLIGWILPYAMLVAIVSAAGLPFLLALARDTRRRLILAAALFVGSAMGMEMLASLFLEQGVGKGASMEEALAFGVQQPTWSVLVTIEEAGEMLAVAFALRALLLHLVDNIGIVRLVVEIAPPTG